MQKEGCEQSEAENEDVGNEMGGRAEYDYGGVGVNSSDSSGSSRFCC